LGCQGKSDLLCRRKSSVEVDGGELLRIVAGRFKTISRWESFFILVGGYGVAESKHNSAFPIKNAEVIMQTIVCLRCRREIEAGHKSVAVYMFAQTVGVRPRQKSGAQRICFCPQCAVSLAMGMPPEGALNLAAWNMIRDLVSAEASLNEAAWESLRGVVGLLGSGEGSAADARARFRKAG
jgi:hypothetical protein